MIFCDLEQNKVIDLLPDRSSDSTAAWLRAHTGREVVSRDRASLYAEAASKRHRTRCRSQTAGICFGISLRRW
jgi:transposase